MDRLTIDIEPNRRDTFIFVKYLFYIICYTNLIQVRINVALCLIKFLM